jgi:hypothetical protein
VNENRVSAGVSPGLKFFGKPALENSAIRNPKCGTWLVINTPRRPYIISGFAGCQRAPQYPLPCACFDYSGFDCAPVRLWWCPPSKLKAGGQKSVASLFASRRVFFDVKWQHETARDERLPVTIAPENHDKSQGVK